MAILDWKKTTKKVTFLIIPIIIGLILIYDVFAIMNGGTESSISSLIITMAYKMPFAVYCIGLFNGILVGHLFWRMKGNKETAKLGLDHEN
jgi:hypothetical protein